MNKKCFLGLMIVFACATAFGQQSNVDPRALELVNLIRARWGESLTQLHEGEMQFEIQRIDKDEQIEYKGEVSWRFPSVRWDFGEVRTKGGRTASAKYTIIDSPSEIITHNLDSRNVFRSFERTRTYARELRIAPWQSWFEYDAQHSWNTILDSKQLSKSAERKVKADASKGRVVVALETPNSKLEVEFDQRSGLLLGYHPESSAESLSVLRAGKFEWVQVDGVPFPSTLKLWESAPGQALPSTPKLVVVTSNHRLDSKWSDNDFRFAGLDRDLIDSSTEFYPDNREPVVRVFKKRSKYDEQSLRGLGESISGFGFAIGPK